MTHDTIDDTKSQERKPRHAVTTPQSSSPNEEKSSNGSAPRELNEDDIKNAAETITRLKTALDDALSSPPPVIDIVITAFIAGGHVLLEDVPGVGKTTMARALAIAVGGDTKRIQFTPDLLPGDLTGVNVYSRAEERFEFHEGPLFANIVIADEVNRANPKAQSAMLEAMGEGSVSVDGVTHSLPDPYLVIATQNPIEMEGTFPLPEAQLDRFMVCTSLGYPDASTEADMLMQGTGAHPLRSMKQVCSLADVRQVRAMVEDVRLGKEVADYIVSLVAATRDAVGVRFGASPRGSLHVGAMARARALGQGRDYVTPDDVKYVAVPSLAHRLVIESAMETGTSMDKSRTVIRDIMKRIPVPRVKEK